MELSNGTLTNIKGFQAENADLTITIKRTDLEQIMMGAATFDDQITAGKAVFAGDRTPFDQLRTMLVQFDMGFEILPGTGAKDLTPERNAFTQEAPAVGTITD